MKNSFLILILILSICSSCEKTQQNSLVLKGKVVDYETQKPIPKALVVLNRNMGVSLLGPEKFVDAIYDSAFTDKNGLYEFVFEQNDRVFYKAEAIYKGYIEKISNPAIIEKEIQSSGNSDTLIIGRPGTVKIILKNSVNGYDSLFLKCNMDIPFGSTIHTYNSNPQSFRLYPQLADTIILQSYLYMDNPKVFLFWTIADKPGNNNYSSVVDLLPLDTVFTTIEF